MPMLNPDTDMAPPRSKHALRAPRLVLVAIPIPMTNPFWKLLAEWVAEEFQEELTHWPPCGARQNHQFLLHVFRLNDQEHDLVVDTFLSVRDVCRSLRVCLSPSTVDPATVRLVLADGEVTDQQ